MVCAAPRRKGGFECTRSSIAEGQSVIGMQYGLVLELANKRLDQSLAKAKGGHTKAGVMHDRYEISERL